MFYEDYTSGDSRSAKNTSSRGQMRSAIHVLNHRRRSASWHVKQEMSINHRFNHRFSQKE